MPLSAVLTERARAKVNLTLHVRGRRADGYHDLESLVAFADCADGLTLAPAAQLALKVAGPRADECGSLDDNLVLKAARALGERVPGLTMGTFGLDKHLPAAAGIGGGSADAAAALRLLARVNKLKSDDARIVSAGSATGADIPVCLKSSACVMRGVGERLSAVSMPPLPAVLINPGVPVATKDVFAALGLRPGDPFGPDQHVAQIVWPHTTSAADWVRAITSGRNDLEPPALRIQPVIGDVLAALGASDGCLLARMSGSGATCFGLFRDDVAARDAEQEIGGRELRWWVAATTLG
jgi:4-diphosphocytidyl-2-C-methyl-D-erythritol kinase